MFSTEQLNVLRAAEVDEIVADLPQRGRVLEIGAGTGQQAAELERRGLEVVAIDLAESAYALERVFPVTDYDGAHIPFTDSSFDAVFSFGVLEHVRDLGLMHAEIRRILKPSGIAVHVLPSPAWCFWSMTTSFPRAAISLITALRRTLPGSRDQRSLGRAWYEAVRACGAALLQPRHGERGIGLMTELWLFHPRWWRHNFRRNGFTVLRDGPMGLFYTGTMLFGSRLSLTRRTRMAKLLGSACHLYVVRPVIPPDPVE